MTTTTTATRVEAVLDRARELGADVDDEKVRYYVEEMLPAMPIARVLDDLTGLSGRDAAGNFHADRLVQIFAIKQEITARTGEETDR